MRRLTLVALSAVACGAVPAHAQTVALAFHQGEVYKNSGNDQLERQLVDRLQRALHPEERHDRHDK